MDAEKLAGAKVMRECAICGLTTDQLIVVCPEDGSALITHKPDRLIGQTLADRFKILNLIGAGGMGNVYKAHHKQVDRIVAIKFLHIDKINRPATVRRFQQEARAAAKLSHPNIVSFFDYGLTDENLPYIVMDYVEGVPLEELIQDGPLPYERGVPLFLQACDALQHAHDNGIIHRDIKPSNLMFLRQEDGRETIKILDFGVAKLAPRIDSQDPQLSLTQTGELFGSPQYMSPEQWAGQTLDARSDMYSLGCVMYEALLGKPAVKGKNIVETIYKHTNERPQTFKTVRPDLVIPEQLEELIFKTLEKDPNSRFPTMSALRRNLEFVPQFAEAEKQVVPPKKEAADRDWAIPAKPLMIAVLGLVVLASAAIGFLFFEKAWLSALSIPIVEQTDGRTSPKLVPLLEAVTAESIASGKIDLAVDQAKRAISTIEACSPHSELLAEEQAKFAELFKGKSAQVSKAFYVDAKTTLRKTAAENRAHGHFHKNLDGPKPLDKTIIELNTLIAPTDDNNIDANEDSLSLASDLLHTNKTSEAEPILRRLVADRKDFSKDGYLRLADGLADLAAKRAASGEEASALNNYRDAVDLKKKVFGEKSEPVAELQMRIGEVLREHKQFKEAEEILLDALANSEAATGGHNAQAARILEQLARLYSDKYSPSQAAEMTKLAQEMKNNLRESGATKSEAAKKDP